MDQFVPEEISESVLPHSRHKARMVALKALYALELSGNSMNTVLRDILPMGTDGSDISKFTREIIEKTYECREDLDDFIRTRSANWEFDRIAVVDKIILRMAICEFLHFWDIPPKVSIDEAIELSKIFSTFRSKRFINGILDAVLDELKTHEQLVKTGRGLLLGGKSKNSKKKSN
ncbi:MAG: transcription antitermination factor NusB [Calditrichaeota bacterium]|nr:transcription antitermination factor NusB [Calditrichota bacterium]